MEPRILTADRKVVARRQRRELRRMPSFAIGSVIALFWLVCAVAPGLFTTRSELDFVQSSDGTPIPRMGPRADAWFGVDSIGRDVYARVVHGAENTIITGSSAALLALLIGVIIGFVMGTSRGWIDEALSRAVEAAVSLPVVLFALLVFAVHGNSRLVTVLTIGGLSAPLVATTVRAAVLTNAQLLAQAQRHGATSVKPRSEEATLDVWRQAFPNICKLLLVELTERARHAFFTVATLSFLGFGAGDAQVADWGLDVAASYSLMQAGIWWPAVFPALALTSLVLATNLIGDAIDTVYRVRAGEGVRPVVE